MPKLKLDIRGELTTEETTILNLVLQSEGQENAVSKQRLMEAVDLSEGLTRKLIRHLIDDHDVLIHSCPQGYYLPATADEVIQHCEHLQSTGLSYLVRASKIKKAVSGLSGQLPLNLA